LTRDSVKVGIIGFGGAGTAHYRYFRCVPGCRVTSIYDPKPEGRARAARLGSPRVSSTLEEFWEGLDAVSVCAPDEDHAGYITEALSRGIHVLSEKPLTESVEGIRKIHEAEKTSRATLAVLHQMRFVPLFQKMKAAVDSGELGAISYAEGYYVHDLTERAFKFDTWRRQGRATPIVYAGCHFVDLLRWLTGEEPLEVFASGNHVAFPEYPEADLTVAVMRFPSSALGKVLVSIGTAGPQDHSVRVYGQGGSIDNNALFARGGAWRRTLHKPTLVQRPLLRDPTRRERELFRQLKSNAAARLMTTAFNTYRRFSSPYGQYYARHFPLRLYEHRLACVAAIEDFVDAARTCRPPLCTADDSARTVLACLAALESMRTNQVKPIDELESALARMPSRKAACRS
jgi:predicted dehydrogenase